MAHDSCDDSPDSSREKSIRSIPERSFSPAQTSENLVKRCSEALSSKPTEATWTEKSSPVEATKRLREAVTSKPLDSSSVDCSSKKKRSGKITTKDVHLHKSALEGLHKSALEDLVDGTVLKYCVKGKVLLGGFKQGSRIYCNCCNAEVSASKFEAHAGRASHKKPYSNIYTLEGVSLHELAMKSDKDPERSQKSGDDLCSLCSNGGSDLRCSECSRTFHKKCASVSNFPMWKWYCTHCRSKINREKFAKHDAANAVSAGRISGVNGGQTMTRPIQAVHNLTPELSSCFLCSGNDFCKSGFGPRTIIFCDQCEKEYHIGCLKHHNMANLQEKPAGEWFCNISCQIMHSDLKKLVVQGDIKLSGPLMEIIQKKCVEKGPEFAIDSDVSWRLFHGKIDSLEAVSLLCQALAIFHDSFGPVTVGDSGKELFETMLLWAFKEEKDPDYHGMYCAVLSVNSKVVCAGMLRVFDLKVAELPFVATNRDNRGKGYLKTMLAVIEETLASLKVQTIVLPSTAEARSMWTDPFGFTDMTAEQVGELKREYFSVLQLPGTTMMNKSISKVPVTSRVEQTRKDPSEQLLLL